MRIRVGNPVLLIAALSFAVVSAVIVVDIRLIRIVLGFPFLLFVPGYLTTAAVFPRKGDLGLLERLVLSFGLSITVIPMLCYALEGTSWGISLYSILATITVYLIAVSLLALFRRAKLPREQQLDFDFELNFNQLKNHRIKRSFHSGLLLAVLFCLGAAAYAMSTPQEAEQFTEFYILGSSGMAADYPTSVNANEDVAVTACVVNNEKETTSYRLEVEIEDHTVQAISPITLGQGEEWQQEITFRAGSPGEKRKVSFYLFKLDEKEQAPYRNLHLWIDFKE